MSTQDGTRKLGISPTVTEIEPLTEKAMKGCGGSASTEFNVNLFFRTHQTAKVFRGPNIDPVAEDQVAAIATGKAMGAFMPTDEVEGMFAAQAVMLHNLAMEAGRRAMIFEQPSEIASKLRKDAANTSRAFSDTVEALARYRGKGPQVVRVERVVVNEGGQAVVGVVSPGTSALSSLSPQQVIAQDRTVDGISDARPVVAGAVTGEGEGA